MKLEDNKHSLSNLSYQVFDEFNNDLLHLWNRVISFSDNTVFQNYDINKTWYEFYGRYENEATLNIVLIFNNNIPIALLPCFLRKKLNTFQELVFLGYNLFDYQIIIYDRKFSFIDIHDYIFNAVLQKFSFDIFNLNNVPFLINDSSFDYSAFLTKSQKIAKSSIILPANYEDYFSSLKTSLRGDSRRQERKILSNGELKYEKINNIKDYLTFIDKLIEFKRARFNYTNVKDIFDDKKNIDFLKNLFNNSTKEFIHASNLTVNNEIISCSLCFSYRNVFYYFIPSFNQAKWGHYSPSRIHLLKKINDSIDLKMKEFDFTLGDEGYKKNFVNSTENVYSYFKVYSTKGFIYFYFNFIVLRLKIIISRFPKIKLILRKIINY